MSPADRLVYMANQIARNLAIQGPTQAALQTADHIVSFWSPSMKAEFFALEAPSLDPIAAVARDILLEGGVPSPQTPATAFGTSEATGGSDAG